MDPLNNRDKRAMNRIRKRYAGLLLLGAAAEEEAGGTASKKKKSTNNEETQAEQAPSTSSAPAPAVIAEVADNLLEKARALSRELRSKLAEREPHPRECVQLRLQLEKLQGRGLSEREIAAFLHKMMLGSHNAPRIGAKWIRFEGRMKPLQILVVRVNCEERGMLDTDEEAKYIDEYFNRRWIRLGQSVRDRNKFWQAISTVVQSRHELLIRKIKTSGDPLLALDRHERKAQLLMSLEQMVDAKYPFPTEIGGGGGGEEGKKGGEPKIRATRKIYRKVSKTSPIFVLDCEMCYTSVDRLELTRISVVDENGGVLMDELVRPHNKITNYLTHKSGITEQMLKNVTTTLKDIQRKFCSLLPDDAILCGHSLENDLEALQLSHPFCADTSLLFNFSGRLHIRSGLKALAKIFLNEDIQGDSIHGHCSMEDAKTTLKLLQLKLDKGLQFGNVALGWNFTEWARANGMTILGTRITAANVLDIVKREGEEGGNSTETTISTCGQVMSSERIEVGTTGNLMDYPDAIGPVVSMVAEENADNLDTNEEEEEEEAENEIVKTQEGGGGEDKNAATNDEAANGEEEGESKPKGKSEEQFFDFAEAVRIDNALQKTAQLSDCFRLANEGKRAKKMLVAMPGVDKFFGQNELCTVMDLSNKEWSKGNAGEDQQMPSTDAIIPSQSSTNKMHSICTQIANKLIDYDFILMELNYAKGTPKRDLDAAFESLTSGLCNNGMVLLVMSGGRGKDGHAIMYLKAHRK